jgi:hypothetical protein
MGLIDDWEQRKSSIRVANGSYWRLGAKKKQHQSSQWSLLATGIKKKSSSR